jgi:hypothetical protein
MIVHLDENNKLKLTEKAMMIGIFKKVYESEKDPELAIAPFSIMYFMYNFDSKFLHEIPNEDKRLREVKKFVDRGTDVATTRTIRKAMDVYKELYASESTSSYLVIRENVGKLKDYASKMELMDPNILQDKEEDDLLQLGKDYILVDSKEFTSVNTMVIKQQEELDKFEVKLIESAKEKIDIYGGGSLGAYE